ncbi:MAG: c-type cytochrome [Acetobacteraceae bacterium]|nr:c-type cytochrome [Acetobacteraceae bacterium]
MRSLRHAVVLAALVLAPAAARAAASPPGASSCGGCHAEAGRPDAAVPSIRGRPASEIAAAMRAYAAGERPATVMDRIAKGFSEDEVQAIAAWISAQSAASP